MTTTTYNEAVAYVPRTGTLYDVLELILDRGMVIDIFVRVSLVGIEILKIDARVVVASVDTYLRFAEVCNRLDLANDPSSRTVPDLFAGMAGGVAGGAAKRGAKKAAKSMGGKVKDAIGAGDSSDEDDEDGPWEHEETEKPRKRRDSGAGSGSRIRSGTSSRTRVTRHAREE